MAVMTNYSQVPEGQQVHQAWFEAPVKNYRGNSEYTEWFKSILAEELAVLQAFHSYQKSPDEAAHDITRPISNSPVPNLGSYSDEIVALCHLWDVLVKALIEWPSSRTPDLIALLTAISNTPDSLHRGEAIDDDDSLLSWNRLPYIHMIWGDSHWMEPEDIVEECSKRDDYEAARQHGRDNYLKTQDVEAQLVAAGLAYFDIKRAFDYLIFTLEWQLDPKVDRVEAPREEQASESFEPDFHIPAVTCWVKHTGRKLYEGLCNEEMKKWDLRDVPSVIKHFDQPAERWAFWKERLVGVAKDWPDEFVRNAAEQAVKYMQDIA
ncbi:DUF3632 domain-containing protein [Aspergillus glaucus CBS 516.65]|uniref:Uncharacterized protein n=1 Tax=Aspergillus glaucus CBS 516.65 TaxID=1160497 RepID=A0A1L9VMJ7_ASPGL|nr:hypothetical protein ASPGLDRAFT_57295 [Aspergillus glaucus CBS 516.65]OJJ85104.1 hypothetical protein ASPGLDRAFT_57295 [Aspergillus glaucus CBS 516.65]